MRLFGLGILIYCISNCWCYSITVHGVPSITKAPKAPLAGVLKITTDTEVRLTISADDGHQNWQRTFYDFKTNHVLPVAGFKANRTNLVTVTLHDKRGAAFSLDPLKFVTDPLPLDFPKLTVLHCEQERMEPGYTLFRVAINGARKAYQAIIDNSGDVVWYASLPSSLDIRQLANGNLLNFTSTNFTEVDLAGTTLKTWTVPKNLPIDNHEALATDRGTILYISAASAIVSNYPSSNTISNAPLKTAMNVVYAKVVEISCTNSAVLNTWSMIDMLDPRRITYMTTMGPAVYDSQHANAIIEDPKDNSIIVSLRHQNAVVKFSRLTGQLIWILGSHQNWISPWRQHLLTPVGSPFGWSYAQHAPVLTPQGTLLVYDNGNFRSEPFNTKIADVNNYSRAVEYQIDEASKTISQVWDYGRANAHRYYTDRVGSAEILPKTGNLLVNFGSVRYVDGAPPSSKGTSATMARIQEVTRDDAASVLFDLAVTEYDNYNTAFSDCYVYRTYRIADLYGHPAKPVADLTLAQEEGMTVLGFSADPARTYRVETSADLAGWEDLGTAWQTLEEGTFHFYDAEIPGEGHRFYRVVTE